MLLPQCLHKIAAFFTGSAHFGHAFVPGTIFPCSGLMVATISPVIRGLISNDNQKKVDQLLPFFWALSAITNPITPKIRITIPRIMKEGETLANTAQSKKAPKTESPYFCLLFDGSFEVSRPDM